MNCERAAVGETDGHLINDNPEPGVSVARTSLKKLYEYRRREAEPMHEARAKAADALVGRIDRANIAFRHDGVDGLKRHLHKVSVQNSRHPRPETPPPEMPVWDNKRRSFMQLMPRHLEWVDELALRDNYNRSVMLDFFCERYHTYFPYLRGSKAKDTPADEFKRFLMVSRLLDRVDARRAEYAEERSGKLRTSNI